MANFMLQKAFCKSRNSYLKLSFKLQAKNIIRITGMHIVL